MSIWSRLLGIKDAADLNRFIGREQASTLYDASHYAIVDVEISLRDNKIHDIGSIRYDRSTFHSASKDQLLKFLGNVDFICGHNIIQHDAKYLFGDKKIRWILVDTLYMSPLLFPERPYHKLVKDDKLMSEQMNNPVNDCSKT